MSLRSSSLPLMSAVDHGRNVTTPSVLQLFDRENLVELEPRGILFSSTDRVLLGTVTSAGASDLLETFSSQQCSSPVSLLFTG